MFKSPALLFPWLLQQHGVLIDIISILICLVVVLCSHSCAVQRNPTGGPPDTTPPRIIEVVPANNSTLVPLDQKIQFTFSESMDRKSLEKAIFITPDPGDRIKLKWKGDKLQAEFLDSLRTNRTYVITLGTDLKDEHNIALAQS
ncbi:Ig-like domain-containing protein, partial [bacterium]|nr:Ig-like domain-containing protein [bacterium]